MAIYVGIGKTHSFINQGEYLSSISCRKLRGVCVWDAVIIEKAMASFYWQFYWCVHSCLHINNTVVVKSYQELEDLMINVGN